MLINSILIFTPSIFMLESRAEHKKREALYKPVQCNVVDTVIVSDCVLLSVGFEV